MSPSKPEKYLSSKLKSWGGRLWIALLIALVYSLFTYQRVWWQDVVHTKSLILIPPLFVAVLVNFRLFLRSGLRLSLVLPFALSLACLFRVSAVLKPYVVYPMGPSKKVEFVAQGSFLLVDHTETGWDAARVGEALRSLNPDIVVELCSVGAEELSPQEWSRYPYTLRSDESDQRYVVLRSIKPIQSTMALNLGVDAYPGLLASVSFAPDLTLDIGAINLETARHRLAFDRTRISARRLASGIRYSDNPRVVFGGFRAPPSSSTTTLFSDQLRLKSVLFNRGLPQVGRIILSLFKPDTILNVFTAKTIRIHDVREWSAQSDGFRGISFSADLPKSPKVSVDPQDPASYPSGAL